MVPSFLLDFCDGTAADDDITVVQDNCLSGSESPLRFVKDHPYESVSLRIHGGRLLFHAGAGLCHDPKRLDEAVNCVRVTFILILFVVV